MQRLIEHYPLERGAHPSRDAGMCAMEMVAWLAGEAHTDEPECACPVLAALVRAGNDAMSDHLRNRLLRPLVPQLVNSRRSAAVERARGMLAVDFLVRTLLPKYLRRHRRSEEAALLAELPPIERLENVRAGARALAAFAQDQRAARWVLDRALEGVPPARFVAGIVQVARALNDADTWASLADLVARMAAIRQPADKAFA